MVIDESAYTAIKAVIYLSKKGGISNSLATARSIGIQEEKLFPVLEKLSSHDFISMDACQPHPILKLSTKDASAYQIITTVADTTAEPELIEAFTAMNPAQSSRWIDVYRQVQSYEGKTDEALKGIGLLELSRSYTLPLSTDNIRDAMIGARSAS